MADISGQRKIHTYRNTSIRMENDEVPRSMQCMDSFTQAFMANMNNIHVNLSLSDDADGSLYGSYTSSSGSSFSYVQPSTPFSDSSRHPSVASEDWALQYSASLSTYSQRPTPPSTPCAEPEIPRLNRLAVSSQMRNMSSSTGSPRLNDYLSANGLLEQDDGIIPGEFPTQEPQLQRWHHSNGLPGTPWNHDETLAMPGPSAVDMEAAGMMESFMNAPFESGSINIGYQPFYGEVLAAEPLHPLTVVPSQTLTLPFNSRPILADPFQVAEKTESVGSPERSHSPDGLVKSLSRTASMYCNPPSPCRSRRAPKKATKRETYRIGFIDCVVERSKKYKCTWTNTKGVKCDFSTKRHEHLKRHKDIHEGKIMVVCPKCNHHFAGCRKDNLLSHIWNTHWRAARAKGAERRDRIDEEEARELGVWEDISRREAKEREKKEKEEREEEERIK